MLSWSETLILTPKQTVQYASCVFIVVALFSFPQSRRLGHFNHCCCSQGALRAIHVVLTTNSFLFGVCLLVCVYAFYTKTIKSCICHVGIFMSDVQEIICEFGYCFYIGKQYIMRGDRTLMTS